MAVTASDASRRESGGLAGPNNRIQNDSRSTESNVTVARRHDCATGGDSLISFMPILLGRRLPPPVLNALITGLNQPGRFLGEWGLAPEALTSAKHKTNGYWRGPIWAPPTRFVVDGLREAGEDDLADDLARRFLRRCARSSFHENFDPRSGDGLTDPASTWTASVFLALGADLAARGA